MDQPTKSNSKSSLASQTPKLYLVLPICKASSSGLPVRHWFWGESCLQNQSLTNGKAAWLLSGKMTSHCGHNCYIPWLGEEQSKPACVGLTWKWHFYGNVWNASYRHPVKHSSQSGHRPVWSPLNFLPSRQNPGVEFSGWLPGWRVIASHRKESPAA